MAGDGAAAAALSAGRIGRCRSGNRPPEDRHGQQRRDSEKPRHMPCRGGRAGLSKRGRRRPGGAHQKGRAKQQGKLVRDVGKRQGESHDSSSRGALSRSAERRSYSSLVRGFDSSRAATAVLVDPSKKVLTRWERAEVRTSVFDEVGE